MDFKKITDDLSQLGLNMIDFALYEHGEKIKALRFKPASNCSNSYSIAKAFVMTAIGMLWDEGRVDISSTIYSLLKSEIPADADPAWKLVTLDNIMTHRVGYAEGFLDIDAENVNDYPTDDYLDLAMKYPISYIPGSHYQYCDAPYYVLSRVIHALTGETVDEYLRKRLTAPMHFSEIAWSRCPKGFPIGATGLYISAKDMVKLGQLYLDGGVFEGKRFLSEKWVDLALAREYEFHIISQKGLIGKGGMYGQELVLSCDKGFAAGWHSFETESREYKKIIDYIDSL